MIFAILNKQRLPSFLRAYQFYFIFLLIPFGSFLSNQPNYEQTYFEQVRNYRLEVTTRYNNLTSAYQGILELNLNTTGFRSYIGHLTWNLTWDDGKTWSFNTASHLYAWNRSYQFAGLLLYTGWWIHPNIQVGDQIQIDGDEPATNNLLRTAPFIVTDLVSLKIRDNYYLCWQLSYSSSQSQFESYYYEFHSGVLIRATSILQDGNQPVHEIFIELVSAEPTLPTIHLLFHYWINYQSLILALIGATLLTLIFNYLLRHLLSLSRYHRQTSQPRQNA